MRRVLLLLVGMASAASAESPVTPGKWQTTTIIESMAMPGMPPEMAQRTRARPMSATYCITPEQAAAGPRDVIGKSNGACRYRSFSAAAGRISGVMECKTGAPTPQIIAISGTYSPVAYDIRSKMSGGAMQSTSRTTGKRLGPC
ncbi:DUF3617 domain-containing protein [Sandarakinorhabdus oryzae]|uniref:DUF3617 domain-containing protein n=1 Tax=Sandarakinorhabdus oryzae TaxID=2675220 RepID=UPI0012E24A8B|nr:DUF3617 domain-containing protein [Sandarakinorhabdus oryzae]